MLKSIRIFAVTMLWSELSFGAGYLSRIQCVNFALEAAQISRAPALNVAFDSDFNSHQDNFSFQQQNEKVPLTLCYCDVFPNRWLLLLEASAVIDGNQEKDIEERAVFDASLPVPRSISLNSVIRFKKSIDSDEFSFLALRAKPLLKILGDDGSNPTHCEDCEALELISDSKEGQQQMKSGDFEQHLASTKNLALLFFVLREGEIYGIPMLKISQRIDAAERLPGKIFEELADLVFRFYTQDLQGKKLEEIWSLLSKMILKDCDRGSRPLKRTIT